MGLLIPEDISLDKLSTSERRVIRTFQSTLKDNWLIIPRVDLINDRRSYEIDVLLINDLQGIAAIEVKGGHLQVRDGEWYRRGQIVEPSPPRQAQNAALELRDQLQRHSPLLDRIHVQSAVALPDLRDLEDLAERLDAAADAWVAQRMEVCEATRRRSRPDRQWRRHPSGIGPLQQSAPAGCHLLRAREGD